MRIVNWLFEYFSDLINKIFRTFNFKLKASNKIIKCWNKLMDRKRRLDPTHQKDTIIKFIEKNQRNMFKILSWSNIFMWISWWWFTVQQSILTWKEHVKKKVFVIKSLTFLFSLFFNIIELLSNKLLLFLEPFSFWR